MVVQVIVAELPVMFVAVRAEMVGAVVSRTIVSDIAAVDQLPAASMNWTNTVLVPAPVVRVQAFVVAKGSAVEKAPVPVLENRICVTLLNASAAESVSVTFLLLVAVAPLLMTIVPVGAWLSTVMNLSVVVVVLPDMSVRTRLQPVRAVGCRCRVPGNAVGRRAVRGAEIGAIQQELHAGDPDIVRRACRHRYGACNGRVRRRRRQRHSRRCHVRPGRAERRHHVGLDLILGECMIGDPHIVDAAGKFITGHARAPTDGHIGSSSSVATR